MNHSKLLPSLLLAVVVPFGVAACGESGSSAGSDPAGGPKVAITDVGTSVPGDQPVSTEILIDRTTLLNDGGDHNLAQTYKEAALQAAAPTIARGGELSVSVFGRVASHAAPLYTAQIPSLAQVGDAARDDSAQTAELSAVLNIAVGLTPPPNKQVADALADVMRLEGSDIGGMIGQGITSLAGDSSPTRNIVLETDGWIVRQSQPPLWKILAQHGPAGAAGLIVRNADVPAGTRPVSLLEIVGLGSTAGLPEPGAVTVEQLDQAYQQACTRLPVQSCDITTGS
ncbi:MAG: hypothetical protein ACLP50_03470 [Solirubrobacteraceae bacterium]